MHLIVAEILNTMKQAQINPQVREDIADALQIIAQSSNVDDIPATVICSHDKMANPLLDWIFAVQQLRDSLRQANEIKLTCLA
ncbi:hypothetical protein [Orrella daihaiensis]|uniref:Uncharacterized protein n=1 Tax=Orrella daihaiensis TaxID=2782176 RepID=A0ABY4AHV3_9BURK|nr:hypothetical protein [Orrella daihaiensis]UOD49873.1 hypothetical protein DHf2319_10525 [Orrella daihaiensis]